MAKWYDNLEVLSAAYEEYGSMAAVAREVGGAHESTLQKAWQRMGGKKLPSGPAPRKPINQEALDSLYRRIYGTNGHS